MWEEPKFDKHAFAGKRTKAVSAETKISFGDFRNMHVQRRAEVKERRIPRPEWLSDNEAIASVVLNTAERRLYLPHDGPNDQRRARVAAESERRLPSMKAKLHRAVLRHHEAAQAGASPDRLQRLEIQVGVADSEIVMLERGVVGILVAVLYLYYNLGYNSVQVAEELSMKPPAVRMLIYTMHRSYRRVMSGTETGNREVAANSKYIPEWPAEKVRLMFLLRTNGRGWREIGKILKHCPASVVNHWKKYFGDLNCVKYPNGVKRDRRGRPRLSPEEREARRQARVACARSKRQAAAALKPKPQAAAPCGPRFRRSRGPNRNRAVVYYVKRKGYDANRVYNGDTAWTPDRLKKLAELWNSGKRLNECAEILGAPRNGAYYALNRILKRKA